MAYAPVGFGSHHWVASSGDECRFVTVDDLRGSDLDERLGSLRRAMRVASLMSTRVDQVVAPQPARDGRIVQFIAPGWGVTVFEMHDVPRLDGWSGAKRGQAVELLARVHSHTGLASGVADEEQFALPGRDAVRSALETLGGPTDLWMTGPYAMPTRQLLTRDADVLLAALAWHDREAGRLRDERRHWVITHGEPHERNLLCGPRGLLLIDWDTALLAPAARDLWHVDEGEGEQAAHYTSLTGRRVAHEDLEFYRLRWDLLEVCSYVEWFTSAHAATPDGEVGWAALVEAFDRLERHFAP